MKLIQVINEEIKQHSLPKTGTLKNGSTVSGYHLLDTAILKAEGWLPLEDNPPTYNEETEYLVDDGYEILKTKVIKKYRIELIPEQKPDEFQLFKMAVISTFEKLIKIDDLTEEELDDYIYLYDDWYALVGTEVAEGKKLRYEGILYKVVQTHTATMEFLPSEADYYYTLAFPDEVIPYWEKPGYEDTYSIGDKVIYRPDGKIYISQIDNNAEEPTKDEPHNRYWVEE